jgi:U32 family peptidase
MKRKIELLAPGGDIDSIKAAIAAGADAIYCGLNKFNARNKAVNIHFEDLNGILKLAHSNNCKVFITLNIIILESEIPDLIRVLNKLNNTKIDAVIIQDLGLFYLLSKHFKTINIHASTQLTTHNQGQIKFIAALNASRVNLSRELSLNEIKTLTTTAHKHNLLTEVFVHGSYCLSFSGICYMSSVHGGNSGNRGRCSQPCREQYITTPMGIDFPLNLKDNSAYGKLKELYDAKLDSLKIEGRIKKYHYVYTVVATYRKQLQRLFDNKALNKDDTALYKVFNRDFSNSYLTSNINKDMFIDNPRDNSAIHIAKKKGGITEENLDIAKKEVYDEKAIIVSYVKENIKDLSIAKAPLTITVSGESGTTLKLHIKTPTTTFVLSSESQLVHSETNTLDAQSIIKRLKAINDTAYFIQHLDLNKLHTNLFLPFKELSTLTRKIRFLLNDSRETLAPIKVPDLKKQNNDKITPTLSVLISSLNDVKLCSVDNVDVYFQLPSYLDNETTDYLDLFIQNRNLIPYFPSILIGEDFHAAVELLQQLKPNHIVTNNTGIAYEANNLGIFWIAGPSFNIVNSYSLLCLKKHFNCAGAFISNEINKQQIQSIKKLEDFKLYYSIYHPITLMTSRQCLFHQIVGCEKDSLNAECIKTCTKSASITNLKKQSFIVDKVKGEYNSIYNETNFLNTEIVKEVQNLFSSFFIDLRDINTNTKTEIDKSTIITLFEALLHDKADSTHQLKHSIHPTNNTQYKKGL